MPENKLSNADIADKLKRMVKRGKELKEIAGRKRDILGDESPPIDQLTGGDETLIQTQD